jgi:coenzyme F420 hydrogenase subunit beta
MMDITDLTAVIEQSLCIGCGACVFADPTLDLVLHPDKLIFEPTHPGNELAARVCPAVGVDFPGLQAARFPGAEPGPFGVVESVHLAQSTDLERNRRSSSGGTIPELLVALLDRDDVDGVIALGHVEGLEFEPRLLTAAEQVDDLPGSIYHNLPKSKVLELLRTHEGRYVLVAIPCELEGIFSYIYEVEPHLAARVHSTVGLLCGWQYSHHALRAICDFKGIDPDTITDVAYRGGGPVGKLRIDTSTGACVEVNRRIDFGYQVAFDRHFNTPRCHLCINHSNFLADIVVGDAWLPSTVGTRTGISLVISRTPAASRLLHHLAETGRMVLTEVSVAEIEESQTRRIAFGDFAYAYADHLRALGLHAPLMEGPNRAASRPVPAAEVAHFHAELTRKLELQRAGRYRFLRWRKATRELRRFLHRYVRWFLVRILRVKSLTGTRREVPRDQLTGFR